MNIVIYLERTSAEEIDTIPELLLVQAQLRTIDFGHQELKIATPEWVIDQMMSISREINRRIEGDLKRRLKNARARREAVSTPDERRTKLDAEIVELEAKLS
jgi:hypothetical protein